jgi:hypothetical protein
VQSVILAGTGVTLGTMFFLMGILADLVVSNRKLLERIDYRIRRLESELPDSRRTAAPRVGDRAA